MDNIKQEIVVENESVRITRFVNVLKDPEDKLLAVMRLKEAATKYARESGNAFSIFTDVTTPFNILVEEQFN